VCEMRELARPWGRKTGAGAVLSVQQVILCSCTALVEKQPQEIRMLSLPLPVSQARFRAMQKAEQSPFPPFYLP